MVDEFQDTNRLQLDVLRSLERDNLFAVGDEFQSIYAFRHADVTIFRERREQLGEERRARAVGQLPLARGAARRRQRDVRADLRRDVPAAGRRPRRAAGRRGRRRAAPVRPRRPAGRAAGRAARLRVRRTGRASTRASPRSPHSRHAGSRRACSPSACARRSSGGRRPGDIVVLVRATASLRLLEQALEDQGLPTYVVGGRGYWSQEQVRDGLAYLAALANPLDEEALYGTLASPFCGVGSDALVLLAEAGRDERRRARGRRCARPRRADVARRAACRRAPSGCAPSRASSRPSGRTRSGWRSRCCSSGRSRRPATTSRCSRAPAASAGWRTCAS